MKKNILLLSSLLVLGGLVACGETSSSTQPSEPAGENKVQVALGYSAKYEVYNYKKELSNCLTIDAASVGFGEDGKILDVRFDSIQVYFGATKAEGSDEWTYAPAKGKTNDNGIMSKLELGKDYNMKPASPTGTEVDFQIEAFADLCVGKTVAEVEELSEEAITKAGVTITYSMYVNALKDAANKKRDAVSYTGDLKAGIGMAGTFGKTYTGDIEASITVSAGLVADNKLVASYTDCVVYQTSGAVEKTVGEGEAAKTVVELPGKEKQKYVVDEKITSKFDLGDAYGMAAYGQGQGENGKAIEWDDQGLAFDAAVAGKTAAQIEELEFGLDNGVTMVTTDLVKAALESVEYAGLAHIGPQWDAE